MMFFVWVSLSSFIVDGMFPQLSPKQAKPVDLQLSSTRKIHIPAVEDGVCRVSFKCICEDVLNEALNNPLGPWCR